MKSLHKTQSLKDSLILLAPTVGAALDDSVQKFLLSLAKTPLQWLPAAAFITIGLPVAVIVSLWRIKYKTTFIKILCAFAVYLLTILEKGIAQMFWQLLNAGIPLGIGWSLVIGISGGFLVSLVFLHYSTAIRIPIVLAQKQGVKQTFL